LQRRSSASRRSKRRARHDDFLSSGILGAGGLTNPGQFFACCGLLELSHRLWRGVEGWFSDSSFNVGGEECPPDALSSLLGELIGAKLSGLDESEEKERKEIEARRRELAKKKRRPKDNDSAEQCATRTQSEELSEQESLRLAQLGKKARKGSVMIGKPFFLTLDWWQNEDYVVPKTWAGLQEIHRIASAAQSSLSAAFADPQGMFEHVSVMVTHSEKARGKAKEVPVEPFYFDARRLAHALDAGFSLDVQDSETVACPAVELLCLIGLQRFRPDAGDQKWSFSYWAWCSPLAASVASGVVCGGVPFRSAQQYQFELRFRDDQKRYKAFGFAKRTGEYA